MLKYNMGCERVILLSDDEAVYDGCFLSIFIYLLTAILLGARNHILSYLKYPVYKELLWII